MLIGPNGAGKTTLFHCITGTLRPTSGQVRLFGHDVTQLAEHRRTALGMGRTFQITNVFTDLTVSENLALAILGTDRRKWVLTPSGRRVPGDREQALAGLAAVGLGERADDQVKFLSYGERRQLELALALSTQSESAVPRRALRGLVAERAAAHLRHGAGAAARHHLSHDRTRHGCRARRSPTGSPSSTAAR